MLKPSIEGIVLIVEDDLANRLILKKILTPVFTEILDAANGEEGYKVFLQRNPDLIITDLNMPGLNGLEMIGKIREKNPFQKFLIMTAFSAYETIEELKSLPGSEFIVKPVTRIELFNKIEDIMKNPRKRTDPNSGG